MAVVPVEGGIRVRGGEAKGAGTFESMGSVLESAWGTGADKGPRLRTAFAHYASSSLSSVAAFSAPSAPFTAPF
jgi:hypothetical protein